MNYYTRQLETSDDFRLAEIDLFFVDNRVNAVNGFIVFINFSLAADRMRMSLFDCVYYSEM